MNVKHILFSVASAREIVDKLLEYGSQTPYPLIVKSSKEFFKKKSLKR